MPADARSAALAWVEGQAGAGTAKPGAHSQEMRVRSLLATLDSFENQRPAFTRVGDVYPERRLNRAHATKKYMLVEENEGGMLKAIPGGNADGWTAGIILKLAGSPDRYFENIVRAGGRRAPSTSSVRTSASKPRTRSAPQPSISKSTAKKVDDSAPRWIAGLPIATKSAGGDYGEAGSASGADAKKPRKTWDKGKVVDAMAALSTPLSKEELLKASGGAKAAGGDQPVASSGSAAPSKTEIKPFTFSHVREKGRAEASSQGAYFAGYSFAGYIETLGEPVFQMPVSASDQKAAKEAKKRAKEALKEKQKKEAQAALAAAIAAQGETPAEKKKRLDREAKVKQMLFNLDQQEGNRVFMATYKRLAILDVIVLATYVLYLIFVYPAREPIMAKNSTTDMIAPARPWFPFAAVTFAVLAVIGNLMNFVTLIIIRLVILFKGVKSPALLPVAKASTYTLYLGVWISFQSTIGGVTRAGDVIERLSNDIGIDIISTIISIISLVLTFLLTPFQLAQIVQSYGILYKALLPIVSINQMGSHLNGAVQQSMSLSSLALFAFTIMYNGKASTINMPTIFGVLYTSVYGISTAGMLIAVAFGRITTMATKIEVAAVKAEEEKQLLGTQLDLDLSKDQEVNLKGYTGKKDSWNGSTVLILENMEKDEKLKVKVVKTQEKSLEDDEMVIAYTQVESTKTKAEREADEERVDLEKKLISFGIMNQRENLVLMETAYLITCQLVDALMVVEIVVSFIVSHVAGLSMFNDMRIQSTDERARAIADNCEGAPCNVVQIMTCPYWKHCGEEATSLEGAFPACGKFCRISDEFNYTYPPPGDTILMLIIAAVLSVLLGMCCGCCCGCACLGGGKGGCLGCIAGIPLFALLGLAMFFFFYVYMGSSAYDFCAVQDLGFTSQLAEGGLGYSDLGPLYAEEEGLPENRPLVKECIDVLSANVVYLELQNGGNMTIMACMLGLAFYLMQSTILLSAKHSAANPLGYSAFQLKFYCYTTIANMCGWVFVAYLDAWGVDEEASVFAESNEWLRNKSRLNRLFESEYGSDFPLVRPSNITDALYIAQGELQWLWLDQTTVIATVVPCILLQFAGLFILTRERTYWPLIQYTMYVQFFMLGYMVFLVWLMCISIRMSAIIIALQFIPTFWLFILPLVGAAQSGMLPVKLPSTPIGACKFLMCPGIPFCSIFGLFMVAAMVMVDATVAGITLPPEMMDLTPVVQENQRLADIANNAPV